MKIAIITDETDTQHSGLGIYTINIVRNILQLDKKNEYYLVHRKKENDNIYSMAKEIIVPYNPRFPFSFIRNFITLPLKLRKYDFDVVHHTGNIGPFIFKAISPTRKGRTIQTLFDIIPLLHPETYERSVRMAFKYLLPMALHNADIILAISESARQDAVKKLGIESSKILITHPAPNEQFRILTNKQLSAARKFLKHKYSIASRYILYAGSLESKKNVQTLVRAYSLLKKKGIEQKLVLVGKKGYRNEEIFAEIKRQGLEKDIIWLGYTPLSPDLVYIYNCADVFVFPSVYEGFGMPVIESMACGCPVITSNRGSLPEVAGNAAIILDAYDTEGFARAIHKVLNDKKFAAAMAKKGLANAKRFSWKKSAEKTIKAYESYLRTSNST